MDIVERLSNSTRGAAQRLQVRSAMNPLLWLSGIVTPVALAFAYVFRDDTFAKVWLLCAGCAPPMVACGMFVYFALARPSKLQSEDYQIREHALELIRNKVVSFEVGEASLDAIAGLRPRLLPEAGETSKE